MSTLSTLEANSLKGALEALLLVSSDPVSAPALAGALDIAPGECASLLAELKVEYEEANRGFQLREVAGGWRLFTHPAYHDVVEAYVLSWDTQKLSQAALETLAVIAYHQPVTREVVKGIRGVNSDGVIASLVDKGLVRELGRDPERGRFATPPIGGDDQRAMPMAASGVLNGVDGAALAASQATKRICAVLPYLRHRGIQTRPAALLVIAPDAGGARNQTLQTVQEVMMATMTLVRFGHVTLVIRIVKPQPVLAFRHQDNQQAAGTDQAGTGSQHIRMQSGVTVIDNAVVFLS